MVNEKTRAMIWALYENEQMSKTNIALKLGVSRNTVYKTLANEKYKDEQIHTKVKKLVDQKTESLIDALINDTRPKEIIDKYLDILNDDEIIKKELTTNGIRTIVGSMKILVENQIKIKELNKKSEPNVFVTPVIVNDADEAAKIVNKQEEQDYETNIN